MPTSIKISVSSYKTMKIFFIFLTKTGDIFFHNTVVDKTRLDVSEDSFFFFFLSLIQMQSSCMKSPPIDLLPPSERTRASSSAFCFIYHFLNMLSLSVFVWASVRPSVRPRSAREKALYSTPRTHRAQKPGIFQIYERAFELRSGKWFIKALGIGFLVRRERKKRLFRDGRVGGCRWM